MCRILFNIIFQISCGCLGARFQFFVYCNICSAIKDAGSKQAYQNNTHNKKKNYLIYQADMFLLPFIHTSPFLC